MSSFIRVVGVYVMGAIDYEEMRQHAKWLHIA